MAVVNRFIKMKMNRNIGWIIAVLIVLTVLVLLRTFNQNLFTRNVADAVLAAKNNTVSVDELQSSDAGVYIVELDENDGRFEESISVPLEKLVEQENRDKLENLEGTIYLYSDSIEKAARAWVILNQLGFDNIFILSDSAEPEAFKYKFQPDTSVGPEF